MIPVRYCEVLPPYWYEHEVAGWHFGVMEEEIDERNRKMKEIQNQFLLQRASWGLPLWEWIYFHREQTGSIEERREAIRRKRLAKKACKLPLLRQIGGQYGKLLDITEEFKLKEIHFEYDSKAPIDMSGLFSDFEYIRPVHILRAVPVVKTVSPTIEVSSQAYHHEIDFPICGLEVPAESGASGTLAIQNISLGYATNQAKIDSPITGFEIPMQGGTT